jgi:GntR family transcriptional regulator
MRRPPTYRELAEDLHQRIETGEYATDEQIPSYRRLAELYGVSVSTVQRALSLLRDRGVVVGQPGRGVYVQGA